MKTANIYTMCLAVLLLAACKKESKETAAEMAMETPTVDVAVPTEVHDLVVYKTFPGTVESDGQATVVANVDGVIVQKCFRDGDFVSKGQVLYRIDPRRYQSAVSEANAAIASAKSKEEFYANQSQAMRRALAEQAVSKINVEEAESNLKAARAARAQAEAQLADAQTMLGYCAVTAPISGQTTAGVQTGTYAGAGQTSLVQIVNNNSLKVVFNIDDAQYHELLGEGYASPSTLLFRSVPLTFEDGVKGRYTTNLYYTSPSVDASTGAIRLEGTIANPGGKLRNGMYVTVDLPMAMRQNALLIKDAAISTDQLGKYVYCVNDSGKAVYTPIKVGQTYQDTLRVVTSGLQKNSRYLTTGLLSVRNGMKVNVAKAK